MRMLAALATVAVLLVPPRLALAYCVFDADCGTSDFCSTWTCVHPQYGPTHCEETPASNCNGADACHDIQCNPWTQTCSYPPKNCNDNVACTIDGCSPATGCTHTPSDAFCSDNNPCTADHCSPASGCSHSPTPGPCNDSSFCTGDDHCVSGACVGGAPVNEGSPCDDNNPCTTPTSTHCSNGTCTGPQDPCNDQDPCTTDTCAPSGCAHVSTSCDDNLACTSDGCSPTTGCTHAPVPAACNDGNVCTTDTCSTQTGCGHSPQDGLSPCVPSDACIVESHCAGGACIVTPKSCDDQNACTQDACAAGNCTHTPTSGPCDDGNPCTSDDHCVGGTCILTNAADGTSCDDGNPCASGQCISGICYFIPPADGSPCDDGIDCTVQSSCTAGTCVATVQSDGSEVVPITMGVPISGSACDSEDQFTFYGTAGCNVTAVLQADTWNGVSLTLTKGNSVIAYGQALYGVPTLTHGLPGDGMYVLRVVGPATGAPIAYTLTATAGCPQPPPSCAAPEAGDPSATPWQAPHPGPNATVEGRVCGADTDMYAEEIFPGCVVKATLRFLQAASNLRLRLLNRRSVVVASSDGASDTESISVTTTASGTEFISVEKIDKSDNRPVAYQLEIQVDCPAEPGFPACPGSDDYEPNNDVGSYGTSLQNMPELLATACPGDIDVYSVYVPSGCALFASTIEASTSDAITLSLYEAHLPQGSMLLNGSSGSVESPSNRVWAVASADGFFQVVAERTFGVDENLLYSLEAHVVCDSDLSCDNDKSSDLEPNDTVAEPTHFPSGRFSALGIVCRSDETHYDDDYYALPMVPPGSSVSVHLSPVGAAGAHVVLDLLDNGVPIAVSDQSNNDETVVGYSCIPPINGIIRVHTASAPAGYVKYGLVVTVTPTGEEPSCDDDSPCTADDCMPEAGCTHAPLTGGACDDGNVCTADDACDAGACSGQAVVCTENGGQCIDYECLPQEDGCFPVAHDGSCSDGNACTVSDQCDGGTCAPGDALQCDDSNPCTDDSCDALAGCQHANNTMPCDDQDLCTSGDQCSDGACIVGGPTCQSGDPCTEDICNPHTGACTLLQPNCDDENPCSVDTCVDGQWCQHMPAPGDCSARVKPLDTASQITEVDVPMLANHTYWAITRNLQPCPDEQGSPHTMVHFFDRSTGDWIASNELCEVSSYAQGDNSCLSYTPETDVTVRIVAHSANGVCGQGILWVGDDPTDPDMNATFGGQLLNNRWWAAQDRVHVASNSRAGIDVIPPTNAARMYVHVKGLGFVGKTWGEKGKESRTADGPYVDLTTGSVSSNWVLVGTIAGGSHAKLLTNDVKQADSDHDGLGDDLEVAMGTCPSSSVACPGVKPVDTDGDGLLDGWEVLGYDPSPKDPSAPADGAIALPWFGASPLHKDVFVEMDWASVAWGSQSYIDAAAVYASIGGQGLNPDGIPGIAVHFDTGTDKPVDPLYPVKGYRTDVGDLGGASVVSTDDLVESATDNMVPSRQGVFRHGLLGGASIGVGWAFGVPVGNFKSISHELGHTLGLGHGGDCGLNCKPNYMSLMNYAYLDLDHLSAGLHPAIVSTALDEAIGLGSAADKADLIQNFAFGSTNAFDQSIDWNRNGTIDTGQVPGVALLVPGVTRLTTAQNNACENSLLHSTSVPGSPETDPGATDKRQGSHVALSAGEASLIAFYRTHADKLTSRIFLGSATPCEPGQTPGQPTPCCATDATALNDANASGSVCGGSGTWEDGPPLADELQSSPTATGISGGHVVVYAVGAPPRLVAQRTGSDGSSVGTVEGGPTVHHDWAQDPQSDAAAATVTLAAGTEEAVVYFLTPADELHVARYGLSGGSIQLDGDDAVMWTSGGLVQSTQPVGVATAQGTVQNSPIDKVFIATVDPATGLVSIAAADQASAGNVSQFGPVPNLFAPGAFFSTWTRQASGRPALAWENGTGKLELWYAGPLYSWTSIATPFHPMLRTWTSAGTFGLRYRVGAASSEASYWDNSSVSLVYYQGHLHAIGGEQQLRHAPFADDLFPIEETDADDAQVIAAMMCCWLTAHLASSVPGGPDLLPGSDSARCSPPGGPDRCAGIDVKAAGPCKVSN